MPKKSAFRNFNIFCGMSIITEDEKKQAKKEGREIKPLTTAKLTRGEYKSVRALFKAKFENPRKSDHKNSDYIITAKEVAITNGNPKQKGYYKKDHYHRNNESVKSSHLIAIDGDQTTSNPKSCIDPKLVYELMKELNYSFILYTTHSHSKDQNRWRLFLFSEYSILPDNYKSTCLKLAHLIKKRYPKFVISTESMVLSQPWYTSARKDPNDGLHYAKYKLGKLFTPSNKTLTKTPTKSSSGQRSIDESLGNIKSGKSFHNEFRDLLFQAAADPLPREMLIFHGQSLLNESARKDPEHEKHHVWLGECAEMESNVDGAISRVKSLSKNNAKKDPAIEIFEGELEIDEFARAKKLSEELLAPKNTVLGDLLYRKPF